MDVYFVLDDHGDPLPIHDPEAWSQWQAQADRSVARTIVAPDIVVLTTFSGHDAPPEGERPRLFVTDVFGGVFDGEELRHTTRAEALARHASLVDWCRVGISEDYGISGDQIQ